MNSSHTTDAENEDMATAERKRVLVVSTAGFTLFFAVWVMFAIVGIPLRDEFDLSDGQFALLAALPIFTGSLLRIPLGIWADQYGGRIVFTALFVATAIPTYFVSRAESYSELLILAFFVGLAGTSFSVGIAWVAAWYPRARQGFALGMFGAGNVGASITKILGPFLVTAIGVGGLAGGAIPGGWRFVPFLYAIVLIISAIVVWFATPTPDHRPGRGRSRADLWRPLRYTRVWRFGLYYIVVFGAYVALSLWLPKYYVDVYDFDLKVAGPLTALFIFPASFLRPVGGHLSDKLGARRVTYWVFSVIAVATAILILPMNAWLFTLLVFTIGVAMGIGKASVYKYVPEYYQKDVGATGGLVGAVGGMGGFFLPLLFAGAEDLTGRPESTFLVLFIFVLASLIWLHIVVRRILQQASPIEI